MAVYCLTKGVFLCVQNVDLACSINWTSTQYSGAVLLKLQFLQVLLFERLPLQKSSIILYNKLYLKLVQKEIFSLVMKMKCLFDLILQKRNYIILSYNLLDILTHL